MEENDEVGGNRNSHVEAPDDDRLANDGLVNDLIAPFNQLNKQVSSLGWRIIAAMALNLTTIVLIVYLIVKIPVGCQPVPEPELPSPVPTWTLTETITVTESRSYVPEATLRTTLNVTVTATESSSTVLDWC